MNEGVERLVQYIKQFVFSFILKKLTEKEIVLFETINSKQFNSVQPLVQIKQGGLSVSRN